MQLCVQACVILGSKHSGATISMYYVQAPTYQLFGITKKP